MGLSGIKSLACDDETLLSAQCIRLIRIIVISLANDFLFEWPNRQSRYSLGLLFRG